MDNKNNARLGKGLSSIFGQDVSKVLDDIQNGDMEVERQEQSKIPVDEIRPNPYQPRKVFDDEALKELSSLDIVSNLKYFEMTQEEKYMKAAIREAKKAYALEEVPIGCVIVQNDRIIARGYNRRNTEGNTLAHAELTAIKKASKKTGDWRLEDCTMYVTLEPCQMCAGAIVQSRMKKVVIGSMNPKAGCAGSVLNLLQMAQFNHQVEIERGVLEEECSTMLSGFFRELRDKKKRLRENV